MLFYDSQEKMFSRIFYPDPCNVPATIEYFVSVNKIIANSASSIH